MSAPTRGSVLVTGASSGIGAAIARQFLDRGWHTVLTARRIDRLAEVARAFPETAHAVALDIADPAAIASALAGLPAAWRDIEILVNNAGHDLGGRRRFDQGAIEDWAATIETNLIGTMRVTHACAPGMIARGRGHIVNLGSIMGLTASAGGSAYAASKFGINGFSKALFEDFKGRGVRVTQIMPGLVRTEFAQARLRGDAAGAAAFYDGFPLTMTPDDIARIVLFAVEQPAHVNIAELVVVPSA